MRPWQSERGRRKTSSSTQVVRRGCTITARRSCKLSLFPVLSLWERIFIIFLPCLVQQYQQQCSSSFTCHHLVCFAFLLCRTCRLKNLDYFCVRCYMATTTTYTTTITVVADQQTTSFGSAQQKQLALIVHHIDVFHMAFLRNHY